jgi:hypothetical protein
MRFRKMKRCKRWLHLHQICKINNPLGILLDISMVDAFHEEAIVEVNNFKTKNIQPNLTGDKNEVELNVKIVLVTQPMLASTTIGRQANEIVQPNSTSMLVQYRAPRCI